MSRQFLEPSTAVSVHHALGLPTSCQNFDVTNACLGFVNGMELAAAMIDGGLVDYALVVNGEDARTVQEATIARLSQPEATARDVVAQFATLTLGSGAAAMVLGPADRHPEGHRLVASVSRAGTEHHGLCVGDNDLMHTDLKGLLDAGLQLSEDLWGDAAAEFDWSQGMSRYVIHQISQVHTDALCDRLGIDPTRVPRTFPTRGNIGPASVPFTLAEEVDKLEDGDRVLPPRRCLRLCTCATAQLLVARGDDVCVLQRRPSGLACREVLGDIADPGVVRGAVDGQDAVVHLAAKVDVSGRWADYARANIDGTRNVVAACRSGRVGRLVHVSSPSVAHAGRALFGVGAEPADPAHARGHYARSKAVAERAALGSDSSALAVLVVRPHLVWGPGDTQLVGRIVAKARAGRLPVIGSGTALIDTTYVDNAAAALVAAVDACGRVHGEPLVVSNGEPRPVLEVLARLCLAAGVAGPRGMVPFRIAWAAGAALERVWAVSGRSDAPPLTRFLAEQLATAHWFDQRRTRAVLGWAPQVSLDAGFEQLAAWHAPQGTGPRT